MYIISHCSIPARESSGVIEEGTWHFGNPVNSTTRVHGIAQHTHIHQALHTHMPTGTTHMHTGTTHTYTRHNTHTYTRHYTHICTQAQHTCTQAQHTHTPGTTHTYTQALHTHAHKHKSFNLYFNNCPLEDTLTHRRKWIELTHWLNRN